ncbi:hypothetical protein ACIXWW_17760 [Bacteroides fragilis]
MFFRTKENTERFNTALGTILHELTHLIGKTDDVEIIDCNKNRQLVMEKNYVLI